VHIVRGIFAVGAFFVVVAVAGVFGVGRGG